MSDYSQPTESNTESLQPGDMDNRKPAIRTMKSDAAELLQKTRSSFAQIAGKEIAGQDLNLFEPPLPLKVRLKQWSAKLLLGAIVGMGILGVIFIFISPVGTTQTVEPPRRTFFPVEKTVDLAVTSANPKSLEDALKEFAQEHGRADTVTHAAITIQDGPDTRDLTLNDLFAMLKISPPSSAFVERIEGQLMPFFYYAKDGPRIGFAAHTRDPQRTLRDLILWEPTLADDLRPIYLGETLKFPVEIKFEDRLFRNIGWRWMPLSQDQDLGLAHSVFSADSLMIITTSQEEMEETLTRLLDMQ